MEIKTIGIEKPQYPLDKEIQNRLQLEKDEYRNLLITGELDNLHDLTIAQEKADIALQLTLSIRNKIVDAYREIMRIQI